MPLDLHIDPEVLEILSKFKTFFEKYNLQFYKVEQENRGKSAFLNVTISIKLK